MSECGLLNLASCLPEKFYDFFIDLLNAPLSQFLDKIRDLMTEPINLELFAPLWAIVMYIISLFYGLLFMYAGFNFMISGHDPLKRAKAKEWFKNIFIMIILIQASYFLYSLVIEANVLLTAGVMNMIAEDFFLITADNLINMGLELVFSFTYINTLLFTLIILTLRYLVVAIGVIFIPFGIFFYFIPPLQPYGRLIFNFLGICIFMTFFNSLVFLACSQLIELQLFENFKILVMISAFTLTNLLMLYLMFFGAIKSAFKTGGKIATVSASVAKYFA